MKEFLKTNAKTMLFSVFTGMTVFATTHGSSFGERMAESAIHFVKKPILNERTLADNKKNIVSVSEKCSDLDSIFKFHATQNNAEFIVMQKRQAVTERKLDIIISNTVGIKRAIELVNLSMAKGNDSTCGTNSYSYSDR